MFQAGTSTPGRRRKRMKSSTKQPHRDQTGDGGSYKDTGRGSHTLPQLYRLGLNRTLPPPVVIKFTSGGLFGYSLVQ